jgi:hypothetical protein
MPNPWPARNKGAIAAAICVHLLTLFASIAWFAVSTKSPTYDEVYHTAASWTHLWHDDFRIDSEDPPLWKYWAALPNRNGLHADFNSPTWMDQPTKMYLEWWWCARTMFKTPGNFGDRVVARSRAMMLVWGVVLGGLIGWWAWRIKGPLAAIVATALFALDPNFLGHSALVKNDIVFSLSLLGLMYALWRAGQKLAWLNAFSIALLCGVMLTVKFSGVISGVLIVMVLGTRTLLPKSWPALGRIRDTFQSKARVAGRTAFLSAVVGFLAIWAVYGFRFAPTEDPKIRLNTDELVEITESNELRARQVPVTESTLAAARPSFKVRCILFANSHRLLPHAWLAGLLYTYQSTLIRMAFLLGQNRTTGWWYYFPLAMLVKTPVATLLAAVFSVAVIWIAWRNARPGTVHRRLWTILCLSIPVVVVMASAMGSNLNIGLRHVFPVYPFIYIAMGWIAGYGWKRWRGRAGVATAACLVLLAIETLAVFPNYISFFNFAAGGSRNGINLLADSNLDWGQDLPLLAQWQRENPDSLLYLSYFGLTDPLYYGIRYVPLAGGYQFDKNPTLPSAPGVVAVSASNLQGIIPHPQVDSFYETVRRLRPINVLGGSIYLYRWPPQSSDYISNAQKRGD